MTASADGVPLPLSLSQFLDLLLAIALFPEDNENIRGRRNNDEYVCSTSGSSISGVED